MPNLKFLRKVYTQVGKRWRQVVSDLVICLRIMLDWPGSRHLNGARFGQTLALLVNIRLGWKGLPRANTLANLASSLVTKNKLNNIVTTDSDIKRWLRKNSTVAPGHRALVHSCFRPSRYHRRRHDRHRAHHRLLPRRKLASTACWVWKLIDWPCRS